MGEDQDHRLARQQDKLHNEGERVLADLQIEPLLSTLGAERLREFEAFQAALTPETRRAILRIKDAWRANPDYRSMAVYDAMLLHGVRTVDDLRDYLQRRQG